MYKVGLIGCGGRGFQIGKSILEEKRCEIVALADSIIENAESMNEKLGIKAKAYSDYKEMIGQEELDFVAICLWTPLHLPVIRYCAEAGIKIILSEKPMAPTWDESLEIANIAEKTGCALAFSHQRRFTKANIKIREMLKDGLLGKIERMDLFTVKNLLDCGTHTIDQAFSYIDESPVKWVFGAVDINDYIEWFNVKAESLATGVIKFENGVIGNFFVGEPEQLGGIYNGIRIFGEKGFMQVGWEGAIEKGVIYDQPDYIFPDLKEDDYNYNQTETVKNILDSFEKGIKSEVSYKYALRATEVIFAIYESARHRTRIELPLKPGVGNSFEEILQEHK